MHRVLTLTALTALSLVACSNSETAGTDAETTPAGAPAVSTTASTTASTPTSTMSTTTTTAATTTTASPTSAPTSSPPADLTTTTTVASTGTVSRDDLVRFIAATEEVLAGTSNEGVVYATPEIYIAIGQAACARFTAGDSFEEVSTDLLAELASASPADDRLVGAVLGAATQTICPEHADLI